MNKMNMNQADGRIRRIGLSILITLLVGAFGTSGNAQTASSATTAKNGNAAKADCPPVKDVCEMPKKMKKTAPVKQAKHKNPTTKHHHRQVH